VVEPALGHFEDELWCAASPDRESPRRIVWHELDVDRKTTFMSQLAAEPLVEDMLDWVAFAAILHGKADGVRRLKESLERVAISHGLAIRKALSTGCCHGQQSGQKCALPSTVLP
jgi:hypothetical protein